MGGDLLTMWTVWQWLPTGFGLRSVRIVRGITDGMVPLHGILGLPGSAGRFVNSQGELTPVFDGEELGYLKYCDTKLIIR